MENVSLQSDGRKEEMLAFVGCKQEIRCRYGILNEQTSKSYDLLDKILQWFKICLLSTKTGTFKGKN